MWRIDIGSGKYRSLWATYINVNIKQTACIASLYFPLPCTNCRAKLHWIFTGLFNIQGVFLAQFEPSIPRGPILFLAKLRPWIKSVLPINALTCLEYTFKRHSFSPLDQIKILWHSKCQSCLFSSQKISHFTFMKPSAFWLCPAAIQDLKRAQEEKKEAWKEKLNLELTVNKTLNKNCLPEENWFFNMKNIWEWNLCFKIPNLIYFIECLLRLFVK